MTAMVRFDPFNNRLCRNVRNALSEVFLKTLEQSSLDAADRVARLFLDDDPPDIVRVYIRQRLEAYQRVVTDLPAEKRADPVRLALVVLHQGLYFETHEMLEPVWMAATGDEKRFFQALIRTAGVYVHLEQGNRLGAQRMATKAIGVLENQPQRLAAYVDVDPWLDQLRQLNTELPRLKSGPVQPAGCTPPTA